VRCGRCGNDNAEANRFCGMCGAALVPKTETAVKPSLPSSTAKTEVASPLPTPVLAGGAQTIVRHSSEAPSATPPHAQSVPRPSETFSPRDPEPRSEAFITGPSFLGLNTPGPANDRYSPRPSSENVDYLLEDEEEPKRGWGKFLLVLVALALAFGFGYLRWKQGGFDWLNASNKKPATTAPDSAQNSDSQPPAAQDRPAPIPTDAAPSTPANDNNTATSAQSTPTQTPPAQNPATQSSPATSQDPNATAANPTPQNTPQQTVTLQTRPSDSSAPPDSASQPAASDSEAAPPAETPAPKARTRQPAPAKPAATSSYDSVAEAERYIYGRGVRQDCDRGLHLLKPAAERADPQAMISLAALYTTGTCTPRDLPTAYRWFALALHKQPDNQALQDDLKSLWAKMTPPERQLAIKLSQ
jgi:hypothetical protein